MYQESSNEAQRAHLSAPAAFGIRGEFPVWAEDSPIRLGEGVLQSISCHGGRVSGISGQLLRCPLRVRIAGLDEGDVAQQGVVGRVETLLSRLLWVVVRHHLHGREETGARGEDRGPAEPAAAKHHSPPALTLTQGPTPQPLCPSVTVGCTEGNVLDGEEAQGSASICETGKLFNLSVSQYPYP